MKYTIEGLRQQINKEIELYNMRIILSDDRISEKLTLKEVLDYMSSKEMEK